MSVPDVEEPHSSEIKSENPHPTFIYDAEAPRLMSERPRIVVCCPEDLP